MPMSIGTLLLILVALGLSFAIFLTLWRVFRSQKQINRSQTMLPTHPLDRHVTAIFHLEEGKITSVESVVPQKSAFVLPSSWYRRWRIFVSLSLVLMIGMVFLIQDGRLLDPIAFGRDLTTRLFSFNTQAPDISAHKDPITPSKRVVRIDSMDRNQYHNNTQYYNWPASSCSGMAMTMVMNAYGKGVIAADLLQKELDLGVWDSYVGLLRNDGIPETASQFGFSAKVSTEGNLEQIIQAANEGSPVIVNVRHPSYFPNGHFFVVRGGDEQNVLIADSAPTNFTQMSRSMFVGMWFQNWSAILTPQ